jgi:hypothetical protein
VVWVRERIIPTDRRLSAKLVPTSADRGCRVISVTYSYDRILDFLDLPRFYYEFFFLFWGVEWNLVYYYCGLTKMSVEQSTECLEGEIEVLRENLPNWRFANHKSHMTRPGLEPGL